MSWRSRAGTNIPDARALQRFFGIRMKPNTGSIAKLASAIDPVIDREPSEKEPVFSLRERAFFAEQMQWLHLLAPLMTALLLGIAADKLLPWRFLFFYGRWTMLLILLPGTLLDSGSSSGGNRAPGQSVLCYAVAAKNRSAPRLRSLKPSSSAFITLAAESDIRKVFPNGILDSSLSKASELGLSRARRPGSRFPGRSSLGDEYREGTDPVVARTYRVEVHAFLGGSIHSERGFCAPSLQSRGRTHRKNGLLAGCRPAPESGPRLTLPAAAAATS